MDATTENEETEALLVRHESEATANTAVTSASSTVSSPETLTVGRFLGAVANLCSATLGAGILALPFALYQSGLIFGGVLLLSSGWATAASINVLVQASEYFGLSTYESIVEKALGRKWRQTVEISILIFCGGTAVAYVIAVGDILERVEHLPSARKHLAMVVVWLIAMLPLSCLKRMQSLQCASSVGIASIFTLLLAATVHLIAPQDPDEDAHSLTLDLLKPFLGPADGSWLAVLRACPIVFFAFSCQVNVCQIYEELPCPGGQHKERAMQWVTLTAVGICALLYSSISLVTLMDFGDDVEPNILSCYTLTNTETLLHVAFVAMCMAVVMAFPLNIFPARVSIIQMISKTTNDHEYAYETTEVQPQPLLGDKEANNNNSGYNGGDDVEQHFDPNDPLCPPSPPPVPSDAENRLEESTSMDAGTEEPDNFNAGQHMLVTLLIAGSALGLALVLPNISVVFGLLGGTTSSLLGFVVPGLLGLQMNKSDVRSWILVVAGTIIGILTTGVTVYSTFKEAIAE